MTIKIECEVSELSELLSKLNPTHPEYDHTLKQAFIVELIAAVLSQNKIAAIKAIRGIFQSPSGETLDLKAAKDLVERVDWDYIVSQ
jgi:ribosomal protein L7/L12